VVGYKPTMHRWPADFGIKLTHFRDTIGPLGVSMDDIALLDEIISN
jgi:Asp-tRNA(Asn)/Glu-tRNA(Gln) amidotransferase A subunit family amidase